MDGWLTTWIRENDLWTIKRKILSIFLKKGNWEKNIRSGRGILFLENGDIFFVFILYREISNKIWKMVKA